MKAAFAYPSTKITLTSLFVTCCLFCIFNLHPHKHSPNLLSYTSRSSLFDAAALLSDNATRIHDNIGDVRNETLGFQEIFVLSLPERKDKRDALTVQAALSNLSITFADGINGSEVSSKALPYTLDLEKGAIGCWRGHLDILQHIVRSRIASALIFEDDADWDVALKYQMTELARGMRFLLNQSEMSTPHSPYGDGWDVVWVGHCSTRPDESDNRRWVVPDDPTVVPPWARWEFNKPDMRPFEHGPKGNSQTRLAYVTVWGSCTAAYAISLKGAEKVLYRQSMLPFNDPVDNGMGSMCREKTFQFSCISTFPTIVGTSTPAGPKNRLSDIHGPGEDLGMEEYALSERLMFPVRQNIERLFRGDTVFDSQYPDVTGPNMSIEDIGRGVGHAEWLQKIEVEEGTSDELIDPELQEPVRAMNDDTNKFWSLSDDPAEGSSPNGEQAYDILETSGEVQEAGSIEPSFFDPLDPGSRSQIAAFEDATYGKNIEDIVPLRLTENPHIHKHGAPTLA